MKAVTGMIAVPQRKTRCSILLNKTCSEFLRTSVSFAFANKDVSMSVIISSRRGMMRVKTAIAESLWSRAGKDALNTLLSMLDSGRMTRGSRQHTPLKMQIIN